MTLALQVSVLSHEEKEILPRPLKLEAMKRLSVKENACTLCFDNLANVKLVPCNHKGFCDQCSVQLEVCPMCRSSIESILTVAGGGGSGGAPSTEKSLQSQPPHLSLLHTSLSQPTQLSLAPETSRDSCLSASSQPVCQS